MNPLNRIPEQDKIKYIETTELIIKSFSNEVSGFKTSITKATNVYEKNEISYHVANVPLLLRLSILDIAILYKHLLKSESDTEQNLFARLICGQLYEFVEDVPKILGKNYRKFISKSALTIVLEPELNELIKKFNIHRNKYLKGLKVIRNNVSSHKDIDGIRQALLIENLDFGFVVYSYINFTHWITDYIQFEKKLIDISMKFKDDYPELCKVSFPNNK